MIVLYFKISDHLKIEIENSMLAYVFVFMELALLKTDCNK